MASYMILTPASGSGRDHEATRFVRDGFSLAAFVFPGLWLLWHRLWLYAVAAFLIEGFGVALSRIPGYWPAGFSILLGVRILAAVEGRMASIRRFEGAGWNSAALVSARNLSEAEEIYFTNLPAHEAVDIPRPQWDIPAAGRHVSRGTALGLMGYDGGRA